MYAFTDPTQLTISISWGHVLLPFAVVGVALASGGVVYALRRTVIRRSASDEDKEGTLVQASLASLGVGIVSVMLAIIFIPAPGEVAQQNRIAWAKTEYGIQLDRNQLSELKFPSSVPTEDQAFGITQVSMGKKIVTVQLYWEDNKFELLGTDGEPLKPLPRAE